MKREVLDDIDYIGYHKTIRIIHVYPKGVCDHYVIQELTNSFRGWRWKTIEGEKYEGLTSLQMAKDWLADYTGDPSQVYKVIEHHEDNV